MKRFKFKFDKSFIKQFLMASVITSFGALLIYSRQHNKFNFSLSEFLSGLPMVFGILFIMSYSMGIFLNFGVKK